VSEETKQTNEIELRKLALEEKRFELEKEKAAIDKLSEETERISKLLEIAKYLNDIQDGENYTIETNFNTSKQFKETRLWNAHEEDVFNASLIQLKHLIGFTNAKNL